MKFLYASVALLMLGLVAVTAPAQNAEQALRDVDAKMAEAAAARDVDKLVSAYAADALVLPPNEPAATTKEAVRKHWSASLGEGVALSWKPTKVEVSGDMGYTTGTYTAKAGGKEVDRGKYVSIWKKQADGSWKSVVDIWNSDLEANQNDSAAKKE